MPKHKRGKPPPSDCKKGCKLLRYPIQHRDDIYCANSPQSITDMIYTVRVLIAPNPKGGPHGCGRKRRKVAKRMHWDPWRWRPSLTRCDAGRRCTRAPCRPCRLSHGPHRGTQLGLPRSLRRLPLRRWCPRRAGAAPPPEGAWAAGTTSVPRVALFRHDLLLALRVLVHLDQKSGCRVCLGVGEVYTLKLVNVLSCIH